MIQKFYKIGKTNLIMEMQINPQEIMEKLNKLQAQVNKLQEEFEDTILTDEEIKLIDESLVHEKEGKLYSFEDIENERNKV